VTFRQQVWQIGNSVARGQQVCFVCHTQATRKQHASNANRKQRASNAQATRKNRRIRVSRLEKPARGRNDSGSYHAGASRFARYGRA